MVKYTDEMKKFIAENVDNTLNKELAEMVNKNLEQIYPVVQLVHTNVN